MQISAGSSVGIRIRVGEDGVESASSRQTAVLWAKVPSSPFLRNQTGGARASPAGGPCATTTLDTATKHTSNFVILIVSF